MAELDGALGRRRAKHWWADAGLVQDVQFELACDTPTLDAAFRLVHDQYVRRKYLDPHPTGWRLSVHNALPGTRVFVARAADRVVGTVTLIEDSPLGLPMDEIYRAELAPLRRHGRRLAEVSGLALDAQGRPGRLPVVMHLMRTLVIYAAALTELDDLCIAVNPRHVEFYERLLHFERVGPLRAFGKVNGAPAYALRLDLGLARELARSVQEHGRPPGELYAFFFARGPYVATVARLAGQAPAGRFTPARFAYFFRQHDVLRTASRDEVTVLSTLYADPLVDAVIDEVTGHTRADRLARSTEPGRGGPAGAAG